MPLPTNKYVRIIKKSVKQSDEFSILDINQNKHITVRLRHISSVEFNAVFSASPSNTGAAEKGVMKTVKQSYNSFVQSPHFAAA